MLARVAALLVVALILGCATSEPGQAQDTPPAPAPKRDEGKKKKDEAPAVPYRAKIKDRFQKDGSAYELRRVVLYVPEVSLFGGGGGEEKRVLVLKRGSAEIECPFERIETIKVGTVDEEFLQVEVTLRAAGDAPAETLAGTVRSSLELRGTFGNSTLATTVKLREVTEVTLERE